MHSTPIQVEEEHSFIVEGGGTDVDGSAIGEDLVFFEIFEVGFIFFLSGVDCCVAENGRKTDILFYVAQVNFSLE